MDAVVLEEAPQSWHQEVAAAIQRQGLAPAVHLPFIDIHPGSPDPLLRRAAVERLRRAVDTAMLYEPRHLVAHNGYNPAGYEDFYPRWLESAISTWTELGPRAGDCPIYLENTWENEPSQVKDVLEVLDNGFGFCFDVGHWHAFGRGAENKDLAHWLQSMAPHLAHLHLHDNDGSADQHLGMGRGMIPFVEFFAGIELLELSPTFTLEPHTYEDLEESIRFMTEHKYWLSLVGVSSKRLDEFRLSGKEPFIPES
ncbi:MAG: sugar phosphate isomerase/epimerase family protein [Desulfonatronovibrionaceae bacterium]